MLQISLAAARVNAGLTQKEVAEKMGVSKVTIISWEKGKTLPNIATARKLAELYEIPLDNIYLSDS